MPLPLGDMIAGLIEGLARLFKALFGLDKPQESEVHEVKPEQPVEKKSDEELLGELGVKSKESKP